MKLFLSSAGLQPETKKDFFELLGKKPEDCLVAFIPTAADPEPDKSYVRWTIDQFEAEGFRLIEIDLKGENSRSLKHKLMPADVIVVNGGNTFYLLDQARKSGFVEIIPELLEEGKIYFGISAGSYLACPTIEAAEWKHLDDPRVVKLENYTALGLVNFLIVAHYAEKWQQALQTGVSSTNYPVATLSDQQAIVVNDYGTKIVGLGKSEKFNGFKETNGF